MALSMDEQRILAEIERQLADDDPSLAARLTTFGRPGLAASLRTPRGRVLVSFLAVAVAAVLSLMVYSLIPLRVLPARGTQVRSTAVPSQSEQTAPAGRPATAGTAGPAATAAGPGLAGAAGSAAARAPAAKSGGNLSPTRAPARQAASPQQARSG
jgi:Protein of unknown function (DUF3040)